MRVLILSVTAGYGHTKCANSLINYLEENNVECKFIDVLTYVSSFLGNSFNYSYLFSTKHLPKAYGKFYRHIDRTDTSQMFSRFAASAIAKKFEKCISDFNPDVIVCTHVCASLMVDNLQNVTAPKIGIITDFTIHPFWDETCADYYVLANENLKNMANKKYIPNSKILPFGIPIDLKFTKSIDKAEARKMLGIADKPTILVMSGSMGFGNILKQIRSIDECKNDFQIISVCGSNKRMKRHIDNLELNKTIHNFGYCDNVDVLMDASDILLTKPGGITVSEAMAKKKPLILSNPIPGQEVYNAEFLVNNGVAMMASKTFTAEECIYQMFCNEHRIKGMLSAMESFSKPYATKDLGDFIIKLINNKK